MKTMLGLIATFTVSAIFVSTKPSQEIVVMNEYSEPRVYTTEEIIQHTDLYKKVAEFEKWQDTVYGK